jgi:hypothetical protein
MVEAGLRGFSAFRSTMVSPLEASRTWMLTFAAGTPARVMARVTAGGSCASSRACAPATQSRATTAAQMIRTGENESFGIDS